MSEEDLNIFRDPLKDKYDIYYRAACIIQKIDEWHDANPGYRAEEESAFLGDDFSPLDSQDDLEAMKNIPTELIRLKHQLQSFYEIVAAHPNLKKYLVSWSVEIEGYSGFNTGQLDEIGFDDPVGRALTEEESLEIWSRVGNVFDSVQRYLKEEHYGVNDTSLYPDNWKISIHCNDYSVDELCENLHTRFSKMISSGLITVRKIFLGYVLIGLTEKNYHSALSRDLDGIFEIEEAEGFDSFEDFGDSEEDEYYYESYMLGSNEEIEDIEDILEEEDDGYYYKNESKDIFKDHTESYRDDYEDELGFNDFLDS